MRFVVGFVFCLLLGTAVPLQTAAAADQYFRRNSSASTVRAAFLENWDFFNQIGFCHRNTRDFINKLREMGIPEKDLSVGFIYNTNDVPFIPRAPRRALVEPWYFHVVLLHDGQVYDFDYQVTPTIERLDQYTAKMLPAADKNPGMVVRFFTVREFLSLPNAFFTQYTRYRGAQLPLMLFQRIDR